MVPRTPGLIWVLGLLAGDVMVDWSIREVDSGRSVFGGPPPGGGNRSRCWELAGRLVSSWTGGLGGKSAAVFS
jgi:hypothetical protein